LKELLTVENIVYNVDIFAEKLKSYRKELQFSQSQVSKQTGVSVNALRLLENGKVIPKLETLSILSSLYKRNLIKEFGETLIRDGTNFYRLQHRIESLFYHDNLDLLVEKYEKLKSFQSEFNSSFHNIMIRQLQVLVGAFIAKHKEDDVRKALKLLMEGLRLTTPDFTPEDFQEFKYSPTEQRILMNLALALRDSGNENLYLKMLEFLDEDVSTKEKLYLKVCHNLATAYRHFNDDEKAIKTAAKGIRVSQENNDYHALHILYFGKAVSEFRLEKEEWKKSITLALYLAEGFGEEQLRDRIYTNCRDHFKMPMDEL